MVRTAILGMGIRGNLYAQGLKQNPDAELVGISDLNDRALRKAGDAWGVPAFGDFNAMLDELKPDVVLICTPDFAHRDSVLAAAARGVHIMVEKPLATSEKAAREMRDAVESAGVLCQVAFENRWNPPFIQIKRAVENGELGDISLISARLNDTIFVPTKMLNWAGRSTVGWFLLPHVLDLAMWLSGKKPVKIYSVANKSVLPARGVDTYDTICTVVTFAAGMQAMFETTWVLPESLPTIFDFKFEILGDKGVMHADCQNQMVDASTDRFAHPGTLVLDIHGTTHGFPLYMLDSFIQSVRSDEEPLATIQDGYEVTRVIDAAHRSIESGEPIAI